MNLLDIVFWLFSAVVLGAAFAVALSRNIVRAAFWLFLCFFGMAGLFVFALADFLAVSQLIVYVGGILILLLFGVMLSNRELPVEALPDTMDTAPRTGLVNRVGGPLVAITLLAVLLLGYRPLVNSGATAPPSVVELGKGLLTEWILPFELLSILLLAALLGAAFLSRREASQPRDTLATTADNSQEPEEPLL